MVSVRNYHSTAKNAGHSTSYEEKSPYDPRHLNKNVAGRSSLERDPELLQPCKKLKRGEMTGSRFSLEECIVQTSNRTLYDGEMSAADSPTSGGGQASIVYEGMVDDASQRAMEVQVVEERLSTEASAQIVEKRLERSPTERGRLTGAAACSQNSTHSRNTSETQVGGLKGTIQREMDPDALEGMVDEAVQREMEVPATEQRLSTQGKEPDSVGMVHEAVQSALEVPVAKKGGLSTEAAGGVQANMVYDGLADDASQRTIEVQVEEERLSIEAAAQILGKRFERLPTEGGRLKRTAAAYTKDSTHTRITSDTEVGGLKGTIQSKEPDALRRMVDIAVEWEIEVPVAAQRLSSQGKEPDSVGVVHEAVQRALEVSVAEKGRLSTEAVGGGQANMVNEGMVDGASQRAMEVQVAEDGLSTEAAVQILEKRLEMLPTDRGRLKGATAYAKVSTHTRNMSETEVGGLKGTIQSKEPDAFGGMVDEAVQREMEVPVAEQRLSTQDKEPNSGGAVHKAVQRELKLPVAQKGRLSTEGAAESMEKRKEKGGKPEKPASDIKVPIPGVSIDSQLISLPNQATPPILKPLDAQMSMVPVENQGQPFFSSWLLWEKVKSMEAFQLLPQRPHFITLDQYNEELREGLAIGYMVAFTNLVEKTCKSQPDDPRSMLEDKLKALEELETLGFEANPVRSRLQELLNIKDRQMKLKEHYSMVEGQIMEKKHMSSIIDAEVDETDKKMKELQQSLIMLNKKRASVVAQKEINCSYTDTMEREVDLLKKKILKGKFDFDNVLATPCYDEYAGGHTTEMLNLVPMLQKDRFTPRFYIAAWTDSMSLQKAHEDTLVNKTGDEKVLEGAQFMQIYRSREVGQSYLTSVGTTLIATGHAFWLMAKIRPQVILCNGPGTCIPLCVVAFFFKVVGIRWSSIFYVESIARVRRLSLSGLLLYKLRMADQLFVQWPQLHRKYPRTQYVGCLM
ncbi:hypothetical protein NE237_025290 [Protea cynaroides]|uniref:UDP-N-acetylglucosamine transferase subunit ALG14 n=1 Tax=Protea cynaroides TaxID=273540 RepID=A0A9Q0H6S7_9MAGN|nr:hypothetical protein NE237_025290 [Protea cynaroides]